MTWDVDPVWFEVGLGLSVRWYGLCVALGFSAGVLVASHFAEEDGLAPARVTWSLAWAAVAAFVMGHVVHLLAYEPRAFVENPVRLIELGSGSASHGAALGAALAVLLYARRRRESPAPYLDAVAGAGILLVPFYRLGNFANSELVGRRWDGPWAVRFPHHHRFDVFLGGAEVGPAPLRHPTQLYEALFGLALLAGVLVLRRRPRAPGDVAVAVTLAYFAGRFVIEWTREPQVLADGPLTMGQWLCLPFLAIAAWASRDRVRAPKS